MARSLHVPPAPVTPVEPEAQDLALLGLVALAPDFLSLRQLFEAGQKLLPGLGLPCPADERELEHRLQRIQASRLVQLERWGSARCGAEARDRLLLHAWRQGWGPALGAAYRAVRGDYEFQGRPGVHCFRTTLACGAFAEFQDLVDRYELPRSSPQAVLEEVAAALPRPLDPAWLDHLPLEVGRMVAWALLNRCLLNWESLDPLIEWLQGRPMADETCRLLLAEALLYQGRVPDPEPALPPHLTGLRDFLQGRLEPALAAFERATVQVKALNRRARTPLIPGPIGWFHALTLIRLGQADQAARLAKVLGGRGHQDRHGRVWDAILDLALLAQGREPAPFRALPYGLEEGAMPVFFRALADYWQNPDGFRGADLDPLLSRLRVAGERLGSPWFQQELRALTDCWRNVPAQGSPLAEFMTAIPAWQRTLETLTRLGLEPVAAKAAAKPRRLAWVLSVHRYQGGYENWELLAREQRQDKGGQWGPGRVIPLHRLRSASVAMDFLTGPDRRTIETLNDRPYPAQEDVWRALHALAGHDALFLDTRDGLRQLHVRSAEPELRVKREGDDLRLELHPPSAGGEHLVLEEGLDRLTVYAFSPRHLEVARLLGEQGVQVPAAAQDQVARAVTGLARTLAIHSDLDLGILEAELAEVPADATPELDLRPWGEGLRAQLRVRPVPGGPAFPPGAGAAELILDVAGQRCRTRRDLERERQLAAAVLEACPDLDAEGGELALDGAQECLELLLQLERLQDQVRVAWPEGERFKPPLRATGNRLHLNLKGEGQWFALAGELRLEAGRVLELQELLALLGQAKGDFLPLGDGQWLRLERHFRERLEGLRDLGVTHAGGLRLAPAAALTLDELCQEAGSFSSPPAWKQRAGAIRRAFESDYPTPARLQATLRPYQEEGYRWLARLGEAGLGACLADDMGLGKTLQALALLLQRGHRGPALVLAPMSVVGNWAVEARRFAPTLDVQVFGEGDRAACLAAAGPSSLVLCSYGLLVQEQERLTGKAWATVILDEAQAIKNADTQRSRAVMALQAEARVVMSGTPVENHLGELWNLFQFLNPGLLGSAEHFTRTFAAPIERERDRRVLQRLKRLLKPFLLRRTRQEVLDELPTLTEIVVDVTLSDDERAFYEALRRQAVATLGAGELKGGPGHIRILAEIMRLRRACCHPRLVQPGLAIGSAKLEAFLEILEELRENRHQALVFSQFVDHLAVVREQLDLQGVAYQYLDGSTSAVERRKRIDAFQAGEGDLFLISLKAGGTGLNLTAADYVIHLDPWWNPAVEDQASGRAHRIGQERPVTVYRLVAADTIEAKILELHRHKRGLAEGLLEGAGTAAALSAEALLELLR
jgi:superfamily II DNA or RNA helicase